VNRIGREKARPAHPVDALGAFAFPSSIVIEPSSGALPGAARLVAAAATDQNAALAFPNNIVPWTRPFAAEHPREEEQS
jgi:hypothetical protein